MTIDTPVAGMRERDLRNGMPELVTRDPWKMLPFLLQFAAKPRWLAGFFGDGGLMKFPNVVLPGAGPMPYADVGTALEASVVTWADLQWIREAWQGPIVVKGVHIGDDARRAIDAGADAIVVSNHGGRQLDDVQATLRVLPEIVAAATGRSRCCSMAASVVAATWRRRSASARAPSSSVARTRTVSVPPVKPACAALSRS